MSIPPRFMNDLRDRIVLSELIGKHIKLTRAGREFKGCCPFHHEKTPSFTVNDDKQFYHCFGCGAHGDAINFTMQHGNLSFVEAIETLAGQAGMKVPQQTPQDIEKAKKQKGLHELMADVTAYFKACLKDPANKEAYQYVLERGISEESIQAFHIGYAPADRQAMRKAMVAKGYSDEQMVEAGVLRRSAKGGEPYAFFRERVMFPVTDRRGRVVAFGGRILPDHLRPPDRGDYKPAKYMNSSDTPLFHKGRMLYAESHARQAAADGQPIIVVEGYLDVIACFSAGYQGAVAPLGTALTEDQILSLWKMIPEQRKLPILCFDGDAAGQRAAEKACDNLLPLIKPDQSVLFAFLPEGQDPDDLIRHQGKAAFQKVLDASIPLADFIWNKNTSGRDFSTPESKAGLEKQLNDLVDRITDNSVQQYYRRNFKDRLWDAFGARKKNYKGGKKPSGNSGLALRRPVSSQKVLPSQILLATIINHPEIYDMVEEDMGKLHITNERLDLLRQAVLNTLGDDPSLDSQALQHHLNGAGLEVELRSVLSESVYIHAGFARPDTQNDKVLSGWKETQEFMQKRAVWQELKQAGQALAQDFSEDNEKIVMGLHDANKVSEG